MLIYRITNIANNKFYIGKTTGSAKNRFNQHDHNHDENNQKCIFTHYISFQKHQNDTLHQTLQWCPGW